jgi:hypothetical protein
MKTSADIASGRHRGAGAAGAGGADVVTTHHLWRKLLVWLLGFDVCLIVCVFVWGVGRFVFGPIPQAVW